MLKHYSVVGSGIMGRGIAYAAALGGYQVILQDINRAALEQAKQYIENETAKSKELGYIDAERAKTVLDNISYTTSLEKSAEKADIVTEAVLEMVELKIEIFKKLDKFCPTHTVLSTNTSTLSPTEIAAQTTRPDKCVAMHFFNPVPKMKLIELIRGLETSDDTVSKVKQIAQRLGKEVVEVNEFPGFVVSRINCLVGNEAMNMLQEGVASAEDIDKACRLGLKYPMGPLELADLVGLDTRLRNMEYLHQMLGDKYLPSPLLKKYVKAGRLGRKSGAGFYRYDS